MSFAYHVVFHNPFYHFVTPGSKNLGVHFAGSSSKETAFDMAVDKYDDDWSLEFCDDAQEDVFDKFLSFRSNLKTCDVVIKSNGKTICAHKIILATKSPYFECLFYGDFSEAKMPDPLFQLDMSQFEPKLVEAAIDSMYREYDVFMPSDPANLAEYMCLASFLQYKVLEKAISNFICTESLTPETCLLFLNVSKRVHNSNLHSKADYFLKTRFQVILKTESFLTQDIDTLKIILNLPDIILDSEFTLFEAVLKWVSFDLGSRLIHLEELLNSVRFELMEQETLYNDMLNHKTVKSSKSLKKEIESFILKYRASVDLNRPAHSSYVGTVETDILQSSADRKPRCYPEELIIYTDYYPPKQCSFVAVGDPIKRCWRGGEAPRYYGPKYERKVLFRWGTELYGLKCSTGNLHICNFLGEEGTFAEIESCQSLLKISAEFHHGIFKSSPTVHHVRVVEDTLFILYREIISSRKLVCRYDLRTFEIIGKGRMLPVDVNPDTVVYTRSCIYAFTHREFLKISFKNGKGAKALSYSESCHDRQYTAVIEKNGVIYFAGGSIHGVKLKSVDAYNINDNTWKPIADFVQERAKFQLVVFMNVLCAVGGNDGEFITVEAYDEVSDKWELDASLPNIPVNSGPSKKMQPVAFPSVPWKPDIRSMYEK